MPELIQPAFHEKIWGSTAVEPWFAPRPGQTGEVWFQSDPPLSLLTKFIFTTERLSIQVHPNDTQAQACGLENGKTEMWHVLRAEPGATLALGFRRPLTQAEARAAALDGSILDLLDWRPVHAGETYFVAAGTVHAIGAGLAVCEIQQNSDTTYRIFDYGRPRELHLDSGLAVSELRPWQPPAALPPSEPGWQTLAACPYFFSDSATLSAPYRHPASDAGYRLLMVLEGSGLIDGQSYHPGQCWLARAGSPAFDIAPSTPTRILRARPGAALIS